MLGQLGQSDRPDFYCGRAQALSGRDGPQNGMSLPTRLDTICNLDTMRDRDYAFRMGEVADRCSQERTVSEER